ncbi:protein TolA [Pseudolabrys taiwanensis]|uniref:Protein TolA n=2 Tax=Pseudolabrys taiwanensis TaxID=331696 RepID=A0A345ZVR6_9HYPH|nr:protein TolA [Pseudolabrys taiwanensis]
MQMKTASMISTGLHAAVLLFAVVSFSGKNLEATPVESMPVDMISEKEFSQITKGIKDAPKPVEKPKPLVEKIAPEVKPVEESKPKVVENKPEVKATQSKAEPPPPEKQEVKEQKPVEKKETKPEQPPAPVAKDKADPIADKIKEAKNEPKPLPPKRPQPPQKHEPKFDVNKIAALIDQRDPQRVAAAGSELNRDPSLGHVNASAAQLSQSEIDAFRRRITDCWNPPVGLDSAQDLVVVFRVMFNADGSVKSGPDVVGGKPTAAGPAFAESARRAILQCQPYTMLRKQTYDNWKDMELAFKPSDMFR